LGDGLVFKYIILPILFFLSLLTGILLNFSCSVKNKDIGNKKLVIAEQFGLAYAPLQIIRANNILEKELPGWEIKWEKLVNTASIREAMLSGNLDIGFMAIPPFLIGFSNGMKWKIFTGLSSVPVGLVTWKDNINTLTDFTQDDRIALPQPGSIQHILLSMAAEKQLGDPNFFDNKVITMAHPDGMNALLQKKDVTAHFTSPPFIMQELEIPGFRLILSGKEASGSDFTFAVGTVTDDFSSKNPEAVAAMIRAIREASDIIKKEPEKAAEILSQEFQSDKKKILDYIIRDDMIYSTETEGVNNFIEYMRKSGYIKPDISYDGIYYR
jgi:NitT/TauT family transport system substrate-binding protein